MNDLTTALAVLSAMITPAVLVSACSSLILTTSQRLGRVIDRTRRVADQLEQLANLQNEAAANERAMRFGLLNRATRRTRLLQRALACLYVSLSVFVAISLAIGMVALAGLLYAWIPIALGLVGAGLLFYSSLLLITESRIAVAAVNDEMQFILERGQQFAPKSSYRVRRRTFPFLRQPSEKQTK